MLPRKAQPLRSRRSRTRASRAARSGRRRRPPAGGARTRSHVFSSPTSGITSPPQSGHPLVPLPPEAAAQPGVADANDPADDDQQEGDNSGEVCQAAKPAEPCTAAARHRVRPCASGYRLSASRPARRGRRLAAHRLADVAQWLVAADVRNHVEVVRRRRRGREPLERLAAPWIVPGAGVPPLMPRVCVDRSTARPRARGRTPRSSRSGCSAFRLMALIASLASKNLKMSTCCPSTPGEEERDEGDVGAEHDQRPRTISPSPSPIIAAGHLREPVVERGEARRAPVRRPARSRWPRSRRSCPPAAS